MKISELAQINNVRRDVQIPLAVAGENRSITLGQILDAVKKGVVSFSKIHGPNLGADVEYAQSAGSFMNGSVIFDLNTNKFYLSIGEMSIVAGVPTMRYVYYSEWSKDSDYYNVAGGVRQDCLFRDSDGRLYFFNGTTLKSAGITEEQATQIRHATPIEVASEEEMAQRIAAGEYEEGQLYFLAEG